MVSRYLERPLRTIAEVRAGKAEKRVLVPAECWEECDDPFCPYTHTPLYEPPEIST